VKQPGQRLAAVAAIRVVVRAGVDGVHRHVRSEDAMHLIEFVWCQVAASNFRLVGNDYDEEITASQAIDRKTHTRQEDEI
jgi:hypothetical protein